jgi:hypothetical protein
LKTERLQGLCGAGVIDYQIDLARVLGVCADGAQGQSGRAFVGAGRCVLAHDEVMLEDLAGVLT